MKQTISIMLILVLGWLSAGAQNANPYISINTSPPVVGIGAGPGPGGNSNLQIIAGNFGNDNIVTNSLQITASVGTNAEILGLAAGSDPRWTVTSLITGPGGTIQLRNTGGAPFGPFDVAPINVTIRARAAGGPQIITGNIAYIVGPNAALGGAPSASQGNAAANDDNSTTSLTVTFVAPVVLGDITATASSCNGVLSWRTLSEDKVDRFEIEYSTNAVDFTTVGSIAAKNTANGAIYSYVNDQGTARGYYRLKMIDRDGRIEYSKIVSVDTKCTGKKVVTIYPNPLTSNQNLNVVASGLEGSAKGELVSMSGQVVMTYNLKNGSNFLPVEKVSQATYLFRVSDLTGQVESFRVVIMK